MGNRFRGGIAPQAIPSSQVPGQSRFRALGASFFIPGPQLALRIEGFPMESYNRMDLRTTGMEFASEMVVKASLWDAGHRGPHHSLCRRAFPRPTSEYVARRVAPSPFFAPLQSPLALLLSRFCSSWPSACSLEHGSCLALATCMASSLTCIRFFTQPPPSRLAFSRPSLPSSPKFSPSLRAFCPKTRVWRRHFDISLLNRAFSVGLVLFLLGIGGSVWAVHLWGVRQFGALDTTTMLRRVIPSVLSLTIGVQIIFSSFFLSVLGLRRR